MFEREIRREKILEGKIRELKLKAKTLKEEEELEAKKNSDVAGDEATDKKEDETAEPVQEENETNEQPLKEPVTDLVEIADTEFFKLVSKEDERRKALICNDKTSHKKKLNIILNPLFLQTNLWKQNLNIM